MKVRVKVRVRVGVRVGVRVRVRVTMHLERLASERDVGLLALLQQPAQQQRPLGFLQHMHMHGVAMLGLLWLNLAMHATLTMIILTVAMPAAAARNVGCAVATVHARPPSCPLCRPAPTAGSEGEREGVNKVGELW